MYKQTNWHDDRRRAVAGATITLGYVCWCLS